VADNRGKVIPVDKNGNRIDINKPGWQHFGSD
jgi:hypothetical protein